jgi:hypothetical protein
MLDLLAMRHVELTYICLLQPQPYCNHTAFILNWLTYRIILPLLIFTVTAFITLHTPTENCLHAGPY